MDQKLFDIEKTVKAYLVELLKIGIRPEQVLLYGSYALGTADEWSDIDLVVISEDFELIPPLKRLELLSVATLNLKVPIEAMGYTPEEIEERGGQSLFWEMVQKNSKVVYDEAA